MQKGDNQRLLQGLNAHVVFFHSLYTRLHGFRRLRSQGFFFPIVVANVFC